MKNVNVEFTNTQIEQSKKTERVQFIEIVARPHQEKTT